MTTRRRIVAYTWDDAMQDYVIIPLDDADKFTLELARRINGRDLTDADFTRILNEVQDV